MPQSNPRVVILGAGFGGLEATKALRRAPVEITLIDRQNYHCFQPLLYQVATAALSPADIAWPIRHILRQQENATVFMAEVNGIDAGARIVNTKAGPFPFDFLVIATGARNSYFGMRAGSRSRPVSSASKTPPVSVGTFCPLLRKRSSLATTPSASGCLHS
jgi:NADH:ubiquinone reductase (H+-translocating)